MDGPKNLIDPGPLSAEKLVWTREGQAEVVGRHYRRPRCVKGPYSSDDKSHGMSCCRKDGQTGHRLPSFRSSETDGVVESIR